MSLVEEFGARLRAGAEELPLGLITDAAQRLRLAGELLLWVRQSSVDPLGVPRLSGATEHLEHAGHALRVAQDALSAYLAAIGLAPGRDVPDPPQDAAGGKPPRGRDRDA